MKFNTKLMVIIGTCCLYFAPIFGLFNQVGIANATANEQPRKTKKVPALRNRVYAQLARAQQIADAGDKAGGLKVLDDVREKLDSMNAYEKAMLWNFYGFMYYGNDNITKAREYFEKVVSEQAIPDSLYLSTLYSLAQLAMQQQDYQSALTFLKKWQKANTKPMTAAQRILLAQIYYQDKQYQNSINQIEKAITLAQQKNEQQKENWLILQRAAYYELKQPQKVTQVMEQLVKLYNKPVYWIQLAGMYGETEQEQKQLATMESAWQAGYITQAEDIKNLAQLYLYHNVPYKAAKLLQASIDEGVIVATTQNLSLLAQSYIAAKNEQQAIPVLIKASEIAENGQFDAQLAQTYLNLEQWQNAINSANKALQRGGIERQGIMHLVLGMAYFNTQQFDQALLALESAKSFKESRKMAKQWYAYVNREKGQMQRLAMLSN